MNRLVMYAATGIVCGAVATTLGTVVSSKRKAAADSLAVFVDSSRVQPSLTPVPASDTVRATSTDTAAVAATPDSAPQKPAAQDIGQKPGEPPTLVRAILPATAVDSVAVRAGRLAKLFGIMTPRDASKVLVQLEDADVQQILSRLSDKQAAMILSNFPSDRAAAITRLVLRRPGQ